MSYSEAEFNAQVEYLRGLVQEQRERAERAEGVLGAAQAAPNREAIHQAAKNGNLQYWRDSEAQRLAFDEWRLGGYVGDCPQLAKGSIVDYITDAVVAALPAPVQSCSAGTDAAVEELAEFLCDEYEGKIGSFCSFNIETKDRWRDLVRAMLARIPAQPQSPLDRVHVATAIYNTRRRMYADRVDFSELFPSAQQPYLEEADAVLALSRPHQPTTSAPGASTPDRRPRE
jgi:hypothetical protein